MINPDWITFVASRAHELRLLTGEHILLTVISTGLAICIAIPLGIMASRFSRLRGLVLGVVGILQTVPSLAMLAILLAVLGKIGVLPAIIALTLYALLPVVRNTVTGLQEVSSEVMEAAVGIGMTPRQQLWLVRMPLALPFIVAGIRTAAVVGVGIATLAAFIGAGGLGEFINRGLALSNTRLILLGAVPAAILALVVDFSIAAAQWGIRPSRRKRTSIVRLVFKPIAMVLPLALVIVGIGASLDDPMTSLKRLVVTGSDREIIRIGSKRFSEQFILGEMMAQIIEDKTDLKVERFFDLGGTMIVSGALERGEIDLYPEYTGTALTAILKHKTVTDPKEAYQIVSDAYKKRFHADWLKPFGFNNAYSITVRKTDAEQHGWKDISDIKKVAATLRAGFTAEFSERPDGYPGLKKAYGFDFGEVRDLDASIMYQAAAQDEVDVICAYTTDGRIRAYNLKPLKDNLHFFPPYYAAPVVREEALEKHPNLRGILDSLGGLLDDETMQRLNFEVDVNKRSAAEVAREFLVSKRLVQ
jgi:osmoprotectant transport system permease protein